MKKHLLLLIAMLTALPMIARDFTYTYEGQTLTYTVLDEEAKTCQTKEGDDNNNWNISAGNRVAGNLVIPSEAKDGNVNYTVTQIGAYSFYKSTSLSAVVIPNSVINIGYAAFANCTGLTSVTLSGSVTNIGGSAFYGCSNLTEIIFNAENCETCGSYGSKPFPPTLKKVTFGEAVKNIPNYAFYGCSGLTSVTIPESVTNIGESAFYGCSGLTSVTIPKSVTAIGENAFSNCSNLTEIIFNAENCETCGSTKYGSNAFPSTLHKVTFGEAVKNIPNSAFNGCSGLTSVTISESVTHIGESAFGNCTAIESVETPSIENWLKIKFEDMESNPIYYAKNFIVNGDHIRRITIPEGIERVNKYAFINCEQLLTVTIPESLKSVGEYAFSNCSALQRFIFPDEITYLGINYDSQYALLTQRNQGKIYIGSTEYKTPSVLDWPESLTRIPDYAFYGNNDLQHINVPETVNEIGKGAFWDCENLKEIIIPDNISQINTLTFYNCSSLESVVMPKSLIYIGSNAFSHCGNLLSVTIPDSLKEIDDNAFYSCHRLKNVYINNLDSWSQIELKSFESNPIAYSMNFAVNGSDVKHLELDIDDLNVSPAAFINSLNLITIKIKGKGIGHFSFAGCKNVTDICLDVETLGTEFISSDVFAGHDSWLSDGSNNLKAVYCMTTEPPTAPDDAFTKYDGVTLYVPIGSQSKYENAETCWWQFLNIVETDFADIDEIFKGDDVTTLIEKISYDINEEDINYSAPYEVFNLNGIYVATSVKDLAPGMYIVRQNNAVKKVSIR